MKHYVIKPASSSKCVVSLAGDKSIAHRCLILSSLVCAKTQIENFPFNKDCLSTLEACKKLGVRIIRKDASTIIIFGKGLFGLNTPKGKIFVGESGTTLRLLLGVLAGQNFTTKLIAGDSLSRRPMRRVTLPLRMMGAEIKSGVRSQESGVEEYAPITIKGGNLKGITYKMPVASAQVKSAILLAALYAKGKTKVIEPLPTRDHTERILKLFGANLKVQKNTITISANKKLTSPGKIYIPGDISSASFFMVLAAILPRSTIRIKKISLNPTRTGIIAVLKKMGADICVRPQASGLRGFEPVGDLIIKTSRLKGVAVKKKEIPSLIDELPILMVAACFAKGKTVFEGIGELRVKETDR
ncbi:MAG: 3-phosphoshikimate 1-carboxyvinyltransferase, partial [Candidatus Omnitrophica bacterium]|nr:3-phosphoshikimate 1-carboxyvinyltransferase [Candidatus Omnitrophota bacterium]